jgi:hypothetical protein
MCHADARSAQHLGAACFELSPRCSALAPGRARERFADAHEGMGYVDPKKVAA